jgi:hypothetical protein
MSPFDHTNNGKMAIVDDFGIVIVRNLAVTIVQCPDRDATSCQRLPVATKKYAENR